VTFVDLLLLVLLIAITAAGFFKGTIRLIIAVITFYASIVLASLYFRFLAVFFTARGTSEIIANAISFFLILFLCFVILFAAGVYTFRYVRVSGRLDYLDRLLGTFLGLVMAAMVAAIVSIVLRYTFIVNDPAATAGFPLTRAFQGSVRRSAILPLLIDHILPRLYVFLDPFLPDAAKPFFQPGR
jgi:membrane protein required for colicin V production